MAEGEKPSPAKTLNINVGILGHVDSGKTSLGAAPTQPSHAPEHPLTPPLRQCGP